MMENSQNEQKNHVPYLNKDCISSILVRLPVDAIDSSRLICKLWHNIITKPAFVDLHLSRSESVLIFQKLVPKERLSPYSLTAEPSGKPRRFSVEASLIPAKHFSFFEQSADGINHSKLEIHFMKFSEGQIVVGDYNVCCLGMIRASCNGLILLDNYLKKGGLIVMNPVTKKLMPLPLGTLFPSYEGSYGFAFSSSTREYKVVHLFRDELGHVCCEILSLRTRCWKEVDGPSSDSFRWFDHVPVSAIGALHWMPIADHFEYILSMDVESEKFRGTPLPTGGKRYDRIIEMSGYLGFLEHEGFEINIWSLKSLSESWTLQHKIRGGVILDLVAIVRLRNSGDVIFWRKENGGFYVYEFKEGRIKQVNKDKLVDSKVYVLPHVNSLV